MVIDKPAGLLVQPGLGEHQQDSLITRLRRDEPALHLIHRLDRDTSGLVMVARGKDSLRRWSRLFAERRIRKLYGARVHGCLAGGGWIDVPLARLSRQPPRYGAHPQGRSALTLWRSAQVGDDWSQLWLAPRTGRSHQLRAHLAGIGHPIVGDPIYGSTRPGRLHLHALALAARHPFTGKRLRLRSALGLPW
ncbi:MAG: RluA family pseudouridine synthase [Synechococcus sp.]